MTLGQRIQELRKGLNLSQEELGERMGVSRQAISKWEGDQTPAPFPAPPNGQKRSWPGWGRPC